MDIRKERMRCTSPLSNVHPIERYKCMDKAEERRLESRISQLRLRVTESITWVHLRFEG